MGFFGRIFGEGGSSVVRTQTIKLEQPDVQTQVIKLEGPLEQHEGHPALSAEMKAQLERSGVDPADVEAALAGEAGTRKLKTSFTGSISVTGPSGKTVEGSLEMQGGHPALSAEVRAELERQGVDPALIESRLAEAKSAAVDAVIDTEPSGQPPAPQIEQALESGTLYRKPSAEDLLHGSDSSHEA